MPVDTGMAPRTNLIGMRLTDEERLRVELWAGPRGLTLSEATRLLMLIGFEGPAQEAYWQGFQHGVQGGLDELHRAVEAVLGTAERQRLALQVRASVGG